MPASITEFVEVDVIVTGATPDKFGFGAEMLVFAHNVNPNRQNGPYFSLTEATDAGFTLAATPELYQALVGAFSQESGVDQVMVGRRVVAGQSAATQVWQVVAAGPTFVDQTANYNSATDNDWNVFPAIDANGNYAAIGFGVPPEQLTLDSANGTAGVTAGGVSWEYWNGTAWTALAGVVDGTLDFTATADGLTVTWTQPTDWAALTLNGISAYYVRAVSDGAYGTLPIYDQGFVDIVTADASWTATMDAIEAVDSTTWYGTTIESRLDADIAELAAWTETRNAEAGDPKIFGFQSDDLSGLVPFTAANLASYNRSWGIYHAVETGANGYLDSVWMSKGLGLNLDAPNGPGNWAYFTLSGVLPDSPTAAEATALYAVNGNLYGRNKGLNYTSKGTMAATGRKINITTTIDWVTVRLQEAILGLQVGSPTGVPFTNAGINQVAQVCQAVLDQGVSFGHFSGDEGRKPTVQVPDISEISPVDIQNGLLQITAVAFFAGTIDKVEITLNVSF